MYDFVSDDIVARMWVLLNQAFNAAYTVTSKKLRPWGISSQQAHVLLVLSGSSSPPTCTEISRIVMRKPHTVTALLNGMQRAGLIKRIKDDHNQKLVRVVMTKKGKEMWKQIVQTQLAISMISFLSVEEIQQLNSTLEKLRDAAFRQLEGGRSEFA